jgi:hypothetical protein
VMTVFKCAATLHIEMRPVDCPIRNVGLIVIS